MWLLYLLLVGVGVVCFRGDLTLTLTLPNPNLNSNSDPDPDPNPNPDQLLLKEHLLESPRWLAGRISNPKPKPKPKPKPNLTLTLTRLAGRSHEEAFLAQQVLA